jgi:hypothetical protein
MQAISKIKQMLTMITFSILFLIIGSISLSLYTDYDWITINFGNSFSWTTGFRTYYVSLGGLSNPSLMIGLISFILALAFFIRFTMSSKQVIQLLSNYFTNNGANPSKDR